MPEMHPSILIIDYILGVVMWTLIGRVAMNIFQRENSEFFFMKAFVKLTNPLIRLFKPITPSFIIDPLGFINSKIRKEILTNHLSFWLNWDVPILIERIKGSKKRPLAFKSTDQEIKTIIKERSKIYSNAQFKINCNKLTKTEIVKKILKIYEHN